MEGGKSGQGNLVRNKLGEDYSNPGNSVSIHGPFFHPGVCHRHGAPPPVPLPGDGAKAMVDRFYWFPGYDRSLFPGIQDRLGQSIAPGIPGSLSFGGHFGAAELFVLRVLGSFAPDEPLLLFFRSSHWNSGRRPSRPRPGGRHVASSSGHVPHDARSVHHHAGGHLLWGHVRWINDIHSG